MEKRLGQELGSLLGLLVMGFVVFLGLYHFSQRFSSEFSDRYLNRNKDRPDTFHNEILPSDTIKGRYVFQLNQNQDAGRASFIYRGLADRSHFLIDVIIPELDPQRTYQYKLNIDAAERGFRLGGYDFKLDSIRKDYVRLVREKPPSK